MLTNACGGGEQAVGSPIQVVRTSTTVEIVPTGTIVEAVPTRTTEPQPDSR